MKKLERDGKVAVVISQDFGAGWSTWADKSEREFMCMDAEIAQAVLDEDIKRAVDIVYDKFPNVYTGGSDGLCVEWVPKGEAFEIHEYDGAEQLRIISQQSYMIA